VNFNFDCLIFALYHRHLTIGQSSIGALDELHGYNSSDVIVGDFAVIVADDTVDFLYGVLSIDSHNCTEGGGRNIITGDRGHDIIIGGGHSIDVIDAGSGSDFASGDCVLMLFDLDFHIRNVSSTSIVSKIL
jgi:hypothetical protein